MKFKTKLTDHCDNFDLFITRVLIFIIIGTFVVLVFGLFSKVQQKNNLEKTAVELGYGIYKIDKDTGRKKFIWITNKNETITNY